MTTRPATSREASASQSVTLDLMHLAAGRPDLSRNPVDHDDWCARSLEPEATCTCSKSPLCQDGR